MFESLKKLFKKEPTHVRAYVTMHPLSESVIETHLKIVGDDYLQWEPLDRMGVTFGAEFEGKHYFFSHDEAERYADALIDKRIDVLNDEINRLLSLQLGNSDAKIVHVKGEREMVV